MKPVFVLFLLGVSVFLAVNSEEIKWCCIDDAELKKCNALKNAVKGDPTTNGNTVNCVKAAKTECVNKVAAKTVDLMSMDGGEILSAVDKLFPVTTEIYDTSKPDLDGAAYYAVAMVKKDSMAKLSNLKGRKTCHTGAGRSAGWKIPMGYLFSQNSVPWTSDCNQYYSAAKYFKQSCVPGVKSVASVKDDSKVSNLCALCSGAGDKKCTATNDEPYFGYVGAFKCMYEGAGEVAFVKQSTFDDAGAGFGIKTDYMLLCKDGSKKALTEYKDCNLGKNPAHAVMTGNKDKAKTYSDWLVKVDTAFGVSASTGFQLYNSSTSDYDGKDLLFKDSTKKLTDVSSKTAKDYLGKDYLKNTKGLTDCVPSGGSVLRLSYAVLLFAVALVYSLN